MSEFERWLGQDLDDKDLTAELEAVKDQPEEINDRFYRDLEFGTGGLRGVIGAGTNRMNVYTVRKATQGMANYLLKHGAGKPQSVAIAHDSRNKGVAFAQQSAAVLAANGIKAYLYPQLMPTPALSFAVRHLHCDAGICVTASHNPAKYNGYKAYGSDGCQVTADMADGIMNEINSLDIFTDVKKMDFQAGVNQGLIQYIGDETVDAFIEAVYGESLNVDASSLKLVYTPLNGAGKMCVLRILDKIGVKDVTVVPEQSEPDGNFPTCPYPNPEFREALEKGLALCQQVQPDLLLATDPDSDRVGIAVNQKGEYVLMTGNEVGIMLLDFIARVKKEQGRLPAHPVAVTTIVSTDMVDPIAKEYGVELRRCLTGFKYIGDIIAELEEKEGSADSYLLGFEESYGYLSGAHVQDKDGVNAVMLACECAAWYAGQGKSLLDAINALYERDGWYKNTLLTQTFEGQAGMEAMAKLMDGLRAKSPEKIGGSAVTDTVQYDGGGVLEFHTANGGKVIVRPSGTEPKIKLYLSIRAASEQAANQALEELTAAARALME